MKNSELVTNASILKKIREDLKKTTLEQNSKDSRKFQRLRQAIKDVKRKNSGK